MKNLIVALALICLAINFKPLIAQTDTRVNQIYQLKVNSAKLNRQIEDIRTQEDILYKLKANLEYQQKELDKKNVKLEQELYHGKVDKSSGYDETPVTLTKQEKVKINIEKNRLDKLGVKWEREEEERRRMLEEQRLTLRKEEEERLRILNEKRKEQIRLQKQADDIRSKTKGAFGKSAGDSTGDTDAEDDPLEDNSKATSYNGASETPWDMSFVEGRRLINGLPKPVYNTWEHGIVVIEIIIDRKGNVTDAKYLSEGSTTNSQKLITSAREAALKAKFYPDRNADMYQVGKINYHFDMK